MQQHAIEPVQPVVSLQGVSKRYALGLTQVHALRSVDLDIANGEFTALVGASGSGKSTLLNMIGCMDEPDSGRVLVAGADVTTLSDRQRSSLRNRRLGFVFQAFNLVPVLTVYENVELPLLINPEVQPQQRRSRVMEALEQVDLAWQAQSRPDQLSGGQRQRVAIARALVSHPALVLADEPTANLDSRTSHKIIDLMLDINAQLGVTFLFSTHDEKLIQRVKRVVHIQDGMLRA